MHPDESARNRSRAVALAVAPAALFVSLAAHPFIEGRLPNEEAVASGVSAGTMTWAVVHLATAVSSGLMIIAFLALRSCLREAGESRRSAPAVPLVVLGSTLFAVLPGMEFVPLAAAENGATTAQIAEAQGAIVGWFMLVLVAGAVLFGTGVLLFAAAIASARVVGAGTTRVVIAALVVLALTRLVPLSVAQFYAQGTAALVALWPLAYRLWTQPTPPVRSEVTVGTA